MAEQLKRYRASSLGDLLTAQQSAQSAIDSIPDPVIIFDAAGVVINLNREAEALLGVTHPSQSSDPLAEVEPALRDVLTRLRAHILAGKGPYAPRTSAKPSAQAAVKTRDTCCRALRRSMGAGGLSKAQRSSCRTSRACGASTS